MTQISTLDPYQVAQTLVSCPAMKEYMMSIGKNICVYTASLKTPAYDADPTGSICFINAYAGQFLEAIHLDFGSVDDFLRNGGDLKDLPIAYVHQLKTIQLSPAIIDDVARVTDLVAHLIIDLLDPAVNRMTYAIESLASSGDLSLAGYEEAHMKREFEQLKYEDTLLNQCAVAWKTIIQKVPRTPEKTLAEYILKEVNTRDRFFTLEETWNEKYKSIYCGKHPEDKNSCSRSSQAKPLAIQIRDWKSRIQRNKIPYSQSLIKGLQELLGYKYATK